ncbi:AAA family ATPase [Lentzea sp. NBC_00516]|uniref:ATP-binding protein n=1 Tax=Lentzea sp. NBC_00516 TaxID=2903582 RepID=UPI002E7FDEF1|nr:AAA family ATPase [Lentzea sp. NBC_00516]WUD26312.1 AAA family ATPase [Lentzea sp. NBC_00516]
MTSQNGPQRHVAQVKHFDEDERLAYLELFGGQLFILEDLPRAVDLEEGDFVFVNNGYQFAGFAPRELWPDAPWVGIVRAMLADGAIVSINGSLKMVSLPAELEIAVGNTVAGSSELGITRLLTDEPLKEYEFSLGDSFDVSKLREEPDSTLTYEDFGGYEEVKNRTRDLIELPLQYHNQLQRIGARAIKGVLFTGSSGTGKTLLGRIIAQQAGAVFYKISGPEIISKYVGQSEEIIRSIFEDARTKDRAIIFFDEIDSVAPQRSDESHEASRRLVGQFLTLMDGFDKTTNVIVIATTNRPQDIDVALRRPGRFDWEIHFSNPDRDDREAVLMTSARTLNTVGDLPHDIIAGRTNGWSPAELTAIWSDAALFAVKDGRDAITAEDYFAGFEQAAKRRSTIASTQQSTSTKTEADK